MEIPEGVRVTHQSSDRLVWIVSLEKIILKFCKSAFEKSETKFARQKSPIAIAIAMQIANASTSRTSDIAAYRRTSLRGAAVDVTRCVAPCASLAPWRASGSAWTSIVLGAS